MYADIRSLTHLKNTLAISIGPWLTVVPIQPCSSICRILGSLPFMAASSLATFIWMSSMATSIGVSTICFCWATLHKIILYVLTGVKHLFYLIPEFWFWRMENGWQLWELFSSCTGQRGRHVGSRLLWRGWRIWTCRCCDSAHRLSPDPVILKREVKMLKVS